MLKGTRLWWFLLGWNTISAVSNGADYFCRDHLSDGIMSIICLGSMLLCFYMLCREYRKPVYNKPPEPLEGVPITLEELKQECKVSKRKRKGKIKFDAEGGIVPKRNDKFSLN